MFWNVRWPAPLGAWLLGLALPGLPLAGAAQTAAPAKMPPAPIEFGQPNPADFEAKNFVADSAAPAVILCDYGASRFGSVSGEMHIISDRITRIKILKKAGYDYATVEVPLYHKDQDSEQLSKLRGFTYVRGADGKLVKTKLEVSGGFEEKRTNNITVRKFTLPAVQEGAVIEYAYTVTSDFFTNYQDWTFQHDIPTRWSEYRTSIPQVYQYKALYQGYLPLAVNEMGVGRTDMMLTHRVASGAGALAGTPDGSMGLSFSTEQHRWIIRDAPAFRLEPYSTTPRDYLARVTFELAGIQMPEEKYRDLTDSWTQKNQRLLESEFFGVVLKHAGFVEDAAKPLTTQYADPAARAAAVRELVMRSMKYDGTNTYHATGPLRRAYDQHRGTAADINLTLIAALRAAGLQAEPVLLSTRAHGRVSQQYPLLEQFNYVVALVQLPNQKDLLLDATEPLLPADILPLRCLNRLGHTVPDAGEGRWVDLVPSQRYNHYQEVTLAFDAQGTLTGQVREDYAGYAGLEAREKLADQGEKKYVAELGAAHTGWEVPSYKFSGRDDAAQMLSLHYDLRQPATAGALGKEWFFNPLQAFGEQRNPFRYEQRNYPVDIGMQQQEMISLTLTLPPGYEAELPKPTTLALPDKGGRYMYAATSLRPGTVQLLSRLTLDKPIYSPEEYTALRELYRQMLAKQAEALVIKKVGG